MLLKEKQFVFIIGSPRSGTTWLQEMLGSHPLVCTLSEMKLFDFYIAPWINSWKEHFVLQKHSNILSGLPVVWTEKDFHDFLIEFLERVYGRLLVNKPGAAIILDKTPAYSLHIEHIEYLIPNAKYIHIIRDGRDVAVSLNAASQGWAKHWAPKDVASAASMWKKFVLAARDARNFNGRYFEIKYEYLLENGLEVLGSIFDFIGLPMGSEELESIYHNCQFEKMKKKQLNVNKFYRAQNFFRKGRPGDWQNVFTLKQKYIFHRIAGDLLLDLGYAEDNWWIDHNYQRITIPLSLYLTRKYNKIKKTIYNVLVSLKGVYSNVKMQGIPK